MNIYESSEDYLEMMLMLREKKGFIKSVDIAKELGVTKPSVSYAVKNLRESGYITMEKGGEIHLTDTGEKIAREVFEKHKLLCSFLKALGIKDDIAYMDACKIEHDLSKESVKAIKAYLKKNNIEITDCLD